MRPSLFRTCSVLAVILAPLAAQHGSARYELVFTSTWSATTHPVQFPSNAHFSPLVGAAHRSTASFWQPGTLASPGIQNMAETGSPSPLTTEIQAAVSANAAQLLLFSGLPVSPGVQTVQFTVSADLPLLTLVTMVAPSPDWFVGVHGVALVQNGDWVDQLVLPLQVYDAGTDSGTTYAAPNFATVPHQPIAPVTTASGPFQGLPGPIGTFTLQRLHGTIVFGCANPADSLTVSGLARLGQSLQFQIHDPTAQFPGPALTGLALASDPAAPFPCGPLLPALGIGAGQPGEVLLAGIDAAVTGALWNGAPTTLLLALPVQPSLVGEKFYLQGLLASSRVGLTNGVALLVGN